MSMSEEDFNSSKVEAIMADYVKDPAEEVHRNILKSSFNVKSIV